MRGASLLLLGGWVKVEGVLWIMGLLKYNQHLRRIKIWWFCIESFITPLQIIIFFFFSNKKDQLLRNFPIARVWLLIAPCISHRPLSHPHQLHSDHVVQPCGFSLHQFFKALWVMVGVSVGFFFLVPEDSPASASLCKGISYTEVSSVGKDKRGRCLGLWGAFDVSLCETPDSVMFRPHNERPRGGLGKTFFLFLTYILISLLFYVKAIYTATNDFLKRS